MLYAIILILVAGAAVFGYLFWRIGRDLTGARETIDNLRRDLGRVEGQLRTSQERVADVERYLDGAEQDNRELGRQLDEARQRVGSLRTTLSLLAGDGAAAAKGARELEESTARLGDLINRGAEIVDGIDDYD